MESNEVKVNCLVEAAKNLALEASWYKNHGTYNIAFEVIDDLVAALEQFGIVIDWKDGEGVRLNGVANY